MKRNELQKPNGHDHELLKAQYKGSRAVHGRKTFRMLDMDEYSIGDLSDSIVPACCEYGCMVEPDGTCPHGNPSILLQNNLI